MILLRNLNSKALKLNSAPIYVDCARSLIPPIPFRSNSSVFSKPSLKPTPFFFSFPSVSHLGFCIHYWYVKFYWFLHLGALNSGFLLQKVQVIVVGFVCFFWGYRSDRWWWRWQWRNAASAIQDSQPLLPRPCQRHMTGIGATSPPNHVPWTSFWLWAIASWLVYRWSFSFSVLIIYQNFVDVVRILNVIMWLYLSYLFSKFSCPTPAMSFSYASFFCLILSLVNLIIIVGSFPIPGLLII